MTALEFTLALLAPFLVALFGHAALWIGVYNRLHAVSAPLWLIEALEKLVYLAFLAFPAAVLWAVWSGFSFWRLDTAAWPLTVYAWVSWGIALGPGLYWLVRRSTANPREVLLSNHSRFVSVGAELDRPLLHGISGKLLGQLPRNEVLDLEINEKRLCLSELPAELEGLSIVHLSDLHFTGLIGREYFEYVVEEANRLDGNFIAVTGDLVDKAACMSWIPETLGRLSSRGGVYGVLGNHDKKLRDLDALRRAVGDAGVTLLGGRWIEIAVRDSRLLLAGDERPWFGPGPDLRAAPPPEAAFRILLAHTPDRFAWAQEQRFALVLAGHNHGGQIRLPLLGPIITPSRHGVKYAGGVFREGATTMHVTRGVSGEHPLRFNCLPELTKLVLTQSSDCAESH
jgi:predicted MPP superfamily phosphohydrolase